MMKMNNKENKEPVMETKETAAAAETKETEKTEASELDTVKAELEKLGEENKKLKSDQETLNDRYLRTLAEYDNYRKRTQREKDGIYNDAVDATVAKLLPILDAFDRASNYECPDAEYKKGIDLIGNSIKECFTQLGIKEIPAMGEQFDPKLHNAVMHVEDPSLGENVVSDVYRKGYTLGEKVIRFSMVVVAN